MTGWGLLDRVRLQTHCYTTHLRLCSLDQPTSIRCPQKGIRNLRTAATRSDTLQCRRYGCIPPPTYWVTCSRTAGQQSWMDGAHIRHDTGQSARMVGPYCMLLQYRVRCAHVAGCPAPIANPVSVLMTSAHGGGDVGGRALAQFVLGHDPPRAMAGVQSRHTTHGPLAVQKSPYPH